MNTIPLRSIFVVAMLLICAPLTPGAEHREAPDSLILEQPPISAPATEPTKPWAADFATFASNTPGGPWLVARSDAACPSEAEATSHALRSASNALLPLLETRLRNLHSSWSGSDAHWLKSKLDAELQNGSLIADRFVQRIDRPYGTLWQESVLLDTSRLDRLAAECAAGLSTRHHTWARSVLSLTGLVLAIYCLYLFLNGVTKGYFTARLRLLTLLLMVLGIIILLSLP